MLPQLLYGLKVICILSSPHIGPAAASQQNPSGDTRSALHESVIVHMMFYVQ